MDKYDKAVKYLTQNPKEIFRTWASPESFPSGCLFKFATRTGKQYTMRGGPDKGYACGCLTTIKIGSRAQTLSLTAAIRADSRLPEWSAEITLEHLPVFADWQRRIDKLLKRA